MSAGKPRAGSPPTQRVVSVVELLTARDSSLTSAEIADALHLSRSTVGAILATLDQQGWVSRLPDLTYRLGPALAAVGMRARPLLPHADAVEAELERLALRVGCAVGLSTVHGGQLIVVSVVAGPGRIPAGIATGSRVPLAPPGGASIIAHSAAAAQKAWLARSPGQDAPALRCALDGIRERGVGVWGVGAAGIETVDVIADVVSFLSDDPAGAALRNRVVNVLSSLSGGAYAPADLDVDAELPISVLTAPVFDSDGAARWDLQIGPFAAAVSRARRQHYISELTSTAKRLSSR